MRIQTYLIAPIAVLVVMGSMVWGILTWPDSIWGAYSLTDGRWAAWHADGLLGWGVPFDLSPFNPFAGMGSSFLPNLPWLNPGDWAMALPLPPLLRFTASYCFYFLALVGSFTYFARGLGVSGLLGGAAACAYTVFLLPPFNHFFFSLPWASLAPVNIWIAGSIVMAAGGLLRISPHSSWGRNLCHGFIFLVGLWSAVLSAPMTLLPYVPAAFVFGLAILFGVVRDGWRTLGLRGIVIGLGLGTLLLSDFRGYVEGVALMSARSVDVYPKIDIGKLTSLSFWTEMTFNPRYCTGGMRQMSICSDYRLHWVSILCVAAAVPVLRVRRWRWIALALLLWLVILEVGGRALYQPAVGALATIGPSFYAFGGYPWMMLGLIICLWVSFRDLGRLLHWLTRRWGNAGAVLMRHVSPASILLVMVSAFSAYLIIARPGSMPPTGKPFAAGSFVWAKPTAIVEYLQQEIKIVRKQNFRGYAALYIQDPDRRMRNEGKIQENSVGFSTVIFARDYLRGHFGNAHTEMDLWNYGIPTFDEYGQWTSLLMKTLAGYLLDHPKPYFVQGVFLRTFSAQPDALRFLGIRFLITDAPIAEPAFREVVKLAGPDRRDLFLYELDGINKGDWSPTRTLVASGGRAAFSALKERVAQLRDIAILDTPIEESLQRAESSDITYLRDGFRVRAKSPGHSLIVLPIQYSSCLSADEIGSSPSSQARLIRVNAVETGVLFSGQVDLRIRLHAGLFGTSTCRKNDAAWLGGLH